MQWLTQLQSSKTTKFKVPILPHEATQLAIVQKDTTFSDGNWTLRTEMEMENGMK